MGAAAEAAALRTGLTPVSSSRQKSGSSRSLSTSLAHKGASLTRTQCIVTPPLQPQHERGRQLDTEVLKSAKLLFYNRGYINREPDKLTTTR